MVDLAYFLNYMDVFGLYAPNPLPINTRKGSDNGPMYTSEVYTMVTKHLPPSYTSYIRNDYISAITQCMEDGLLNRTPLALGRSGQEGPDDYYGVLSACKVLGITSIPRQFLRAVIRYKGFLNNENPGVKTARSFLIRQPQLLCAMISAAYPSKLNPIHWIIRLLALPLYLVAALVILTSCIDTVYSDTDARRLSWHLIQATRPVSILCKIASLFWYHRLYDTYGPEGMRRVAAIYYHPENTNPYARYWVND